MAVESVVTFAAKGILTKLISRAAEEIGLAWGFKEELKRLRKTLSDIQGYLNEFANRPQGDVQALEKWVKQLKDIAHDADDVLDDFDYERLRRKVEIRNHMRRKVLNFLSPSNPAAFRLTMAHKIRKINESLADLKNEANVLNLVSNQRINEPTQSIPWHRESNSFIGADESKLNSSKESKIVLTTGSSEVARITETLPRCDLGKLSVDECWRILKDTAFPNSNARISDELQEIGMEIAKRCAGLPLAAKLLGGILYNDDSTAKWLSVKESRYFNFQEGQDGIMSILKLSFDNLALPSLKQCFAYCSMFMKDAEIERSNLIQLWMASGLLHPSLDMDKEMEDIGNYYFDILLHSSLFQDPEMDEYRVITKCKMHGLVHDLAELVSKNESLTEDKLVDDTLGIRHVARVSTSLLQSFPESIVGRLQSLFLDGEFPHDEMLHRFRALRVLNLCKANIQKLPNSIGKLKHLRYVNISETDIQELPASIGKLYHLQTLRATECAELKEFPKEVLNLINLRHVYFDKSTKFPSGLGQLKSLRTLPPFSVDEEKGREIAELATLNELKGELEIFDLECVSDGDEARKSKLKEKKNLCHLIFKWKEDRPPSNNNEVDVLEGLEPHPNLESLTVDSFMGAKFPSWMMFRSFGLYKLKKVVLRACSQCEEVPELGHLPYLATLKIYQMSSLKCLGAKFYGYDHVSNTATTSQRKTTLFPALKVLHIERCEELIEWMEPPAQFVVVFPCLEKLKILDCHKLRNVPSHFPYLRELWIESCEGLSRLPSGLEHCTSLESLVISRCGELSSLPALQHFPSLRVLWVSGCPKLKSISSYSVTLPLDCAHSSSCSSAPEIFTNSSLEDLRIYDCRTLQSIPDPHSFTSLSELRIVNCDGLTSLVGSSGPVSLEEEVETLPTSLCYLTICGGGKLKCLLKGPHRLTRLKDLRIGGFGEELDSFPDFQIGSSSLQDLWLHGWPELTSLPQQIQQFTSLRSLNIYSFGLEALPEWLDNLTSLHILSIWNCENLMYLPTVEAMQRLTNLRTLVISGCALLRERCTNLGPEWPKISRIPDLQGIETAVRFVRRTVG